MHEQLDPTRRELEILKILWGSGEATVRQVYEEMRQRAPIVQNTVQAFLRTMEDKGLVTHEQRGRAFVYRPLLRQKQTARQLVGRLLDRVYDGAMDQLVDGLLSIRQPTAEELRQLESLIDRAKAAQEQQPKPREDRS